MAAKAKLIHSVSTEHLKIAVACGPSSSIILFTNHKMPTANTPRTIVVIGATGNQGGGVLRALLASDKSWHVRALTQDVSSSKAKALLDEFPLDAEAGRLTLARGNVYDPSSLRSAFSGAYGVFAITSESYPGKVLVHEAEMLHEIEAGRNIISAAKETGVEHFVFSSLPDMVKTTGGRFTGIYHMDNKHAIEKIAKEHLSGVTCLIPGLYFLKGDSYDFLTRILTENFYMQASFTRT